MNRLKLLLFFFLPLVLVSCLSHVINFKHKTPYKPAKLPVFTIKDSLIGFNNPYRSCYDVKHYDIHVTIHPVRKSIQGFVTSYLQLTNPSVIIQLDLDAHLVIDSVKQHTHTLKFTRQHTAVYVELNSSETDQAVTVYYHGKPAVARHPPWEGGFVWSRDKNKKPVVALACEGEGAKTWLPVKTYLGDEPDSVSMYLSVPKDMVGVSNGKLVSVSEDSAMKTFHWKTSYPINPYNITLYAGDYKSFEIPYTSVTGEKTTLTYYVLPYNYEKAKAHFVQTEKILNVYEELFGPYPWPKDGFKLVESPFAGMEHQTAIAYGNGYKNEKDQEFDYIILHETAHEWWGNAVSAADFSDIWIHEGFATYAEALYVEKTKGTQAYLRYMLWTMMTVMNKKPLIGPPGVYYWNYKDIDPYTKGSAVLHTLRNHINDDSLFFSLLRTFYKNSCYKITNTNEFITLANKMTGKNLNAFFDQYLYQRSSPYLLWNIDYNTELKCNQLIFKFDHCVSGFTTPIQVEQGGDTFYIHPTNELQLYMLPHSSNVPVKMNVKQSYLQNGYKKLARIKRH